MSRRLPYWLGAVAGVQLAVSGCAGLVATHSVASSVPAAPTAPAVTIGGSPVTSQSSPSCYEPPLDNRPYKYANHSDIDTLASSVDALIAAGGVPGYAGLYMDGPDDQVNIYLVGPAPEALRQIAAQARHAVLVVHPARFTEVQMNAAMMRVVTAHPAVAAPGGYLLAKVGPCGDGSGISVTVFNVHHKDRPPSSVPDVIAIRVRELAGNVPVLVVPGVDNARLE